MRPMEPAQAQLHDIVQAFEAARARLHALVAGLPEGRWAKRPGDHRWSFAECVAHLNLTAEAYLPLLRRAVDEARSLVPHPRTRRYRMDWAGRLVAVAAGPLPRLGAVRLGGAPTAAAFVPGEDLAKETILSAFDRLQESQVAQVRESEGLPLDRVWVRSPFNAKLRYNCFACFVILPRHQQRHLDQAEQVMRALEHA